jgi:hypothetical protein
MMKPSRIAREQMGREPTQSQETVCKYCFPDDFKVPQALKYHIFLDHWGTTRQEMYLKEAEYNEARSREFQ